MPLLSGLRLGSTAATRAYKGGLQVWSATPPVVLPTALIDLDPNTIGATSGTVASLPDVSGNNRNFTTAVTADQPTVLNNAINGRKALFFDADGLVNTATGITGLTAFTLVAVVAMQTNTSKGTFMSSLGNASQFDYNQTDGSWFLSSPSAANPTNFNTMQAGGSIVTTNDVNMKSATHALGTYYVVTIQAGTDNQALRLWVNGTADPTTPAGRSATSVGLSHLIIGARNFNSGAVAGERGRFNLARLRFYAGRLSTTDRQNVERDLGTTFGLTVA